LRCRLIGSRPYVPRSRFTPFFSKRKHARRSIGSRRGWPRDRRQRRVADALVGNATNFLLYAEDATYCLL
jgi:hypothetical protein